MTLSKDCQGWPKTKLAHDVGASIMELSPRLVRQTGHGTTLVEPGQERSEGRFAEGVAGRAPDVSVVIRTHSHDRWDSLLAAIASIKAQTLPPRELIVVVDHNDALRVKVASLPGVNTVANTYPGGASGAMNAGIAASNSEIVAFLDDDATAASDWLERLVPHYQDGKVMGVGGEIVPIWSTGRPRWFPDEFNWVIGCTHSRSREQAGVVRNLIGANMSFRRSIADSVGGFANGIGAFAGNKMLRGEDTEFCIRSSQRWPDHWWIHEPNARVYHHQPAARASFTYFRSICYAQGLTKAQITQRLGMRSGLDLEWQYVLRTLPLGIVQAFRKTLSGDKAGLGQAAAIVSGLALASTGYIVGSVVSLLKAVQPPSLTPVAHLVGPSLRPLSLDKVQDHSNNGLPHMLRHNGHIHAGAEEYLASSELTDLSPS